MIDQSNELREFVTHLSFPGERRKYRFGNHAPEAETEADVGTRRAPANDASALSTTDLPGMPQFQQVSRFWVNWINGLVQLALIFPAANDKRFAADAWRADPRFYTLQRSYITYSNFLQHGLESAPLSESAKAKLRFMMRQVVDAISPANFFMTNPEAIQLALETKGQSLVKGAELFLQDAAKGRISMSDEQAFEVGKNIAVTEGDVIYENQLMQVIQYKPLTAQVGQRPLVIIPPCINKFYILDLQPDNSMVRYLIEQGTTVFMLSWRNITPELGHLTWDDYLQKGVMQAIDVALDVTGVEQVNALGFCIGGALLTSAVSLMQEWDDNKVASMTLLTTMLDYSDTGEIGALVTEQSVAAREQAIGKGGMMPGKELAVTFSSLRANDLIWPYVVNSYLKGKEPPAFDLLYWNADATNLPGPMFTWYVRNTYLENKLCLPGETIQCGAPVDVSKITIPTYLYASREDHLVPWRTCFVSTQLLKANTVFTLGASGHIAGVINPPAKNKRNYWIDGVLGGTADDWYASAQEVPGSWWPHWRDWLRTHAGPMVPAPSETGNERYRPTEPAPGRYVMQRAD